MLGWLAAVLKLDVDELIGKYALVDRSSLPPRELEDEAATLRTAGLAAGATLLLQPRAGGAPVRGGAARRVPPRRARKSEAPPPSRR